MSQIPAQPTAIRPKERAFKNINPQTHWRSQREMIFGGIEMKAKNIKRQQLVTHALYGIKHSSDTDRLFSALFCLLPSSTWRLLSAISSRSLLPAWEERERRKKWSIGPQRVRAGPERISLCRLLFVRRASWDNGNSLPDRNFFSKFCFFVDKKS